MAENPYVSSAAGAAGAASSNFAATLRYVTALREAADQQQKLQQQQDFEYRKEVMELQKGGYIPAENTTGGTIAKGGLGQRTPNPAAQGPGTSVTDTRGAKWFKANPAPEEKLDESNSVPIGGDLADKLTAAGSAGYKGDTRVKPEVYKSLTERFQEKKPGAKHLRVDTEHFSSPVMIDEDTNEVTPLKLPEGITHNAPKPEKEPKTTYHYQTDDNGNLTRFPNEDEGVPQTWNGKAWVTAGAQVGIKHKDPNAPPAEKPVSKSKIASIRNHYRDALDRAQKARDRAIQASSFNGQVWDQEGVKEAQDEYQRAKAEARDRLAQDLGDYNLDPNDAGIDTNEAGAGASTVPGMPSGVPPGPPRAPIPPELQAGGTPAQRAQQTQAKPAGGEQAGPPSRSASPVTKQAPRAAAPRPGSSGTTTIGKVQEYAKKYGLTIGQALRQAQAEGFAVRGQ
jgi:hypothetical protein